MRLIKNILYCVIIFSAGFFGYIYIINHFDLDKIKLDKQPIKEVKVPSEIIVTSKGTELEVFEYDGYKVLLHSGEIEVLYHIESDHMLKQELDMNYE
jgi:hypothetical protein